jgi:hypothetical protein
MGLTERRVTSCVPYHERINLILHKYHGSDRSMSQTYPTKKKQRNADPKNQIVSPCPEQIDMGSTHFSSRN